MTQELSQISLAAMIFYSLVCGFLSGTFYDLFRIRRCSYKKSSKLLHKIIEYAIIFAEDMIFFVLCALCCAVIFYATNYGRVRMSALAMFFIGHIIWHFTFGRLVMACAQRIIRFISGCLAFLHRYVSEPLMCAIKRIFCLISGLFEGRRRKRYTAKRMEERIKSAEKGFCIK